jgi:energy-coupling factor transporter ATP-binding protein EcfA2
MRQTRDEPPADLAPFTWPAIARGSRASFLGPSGSGKTELAKALLRAQRNAIVIDTKRTEGWADVGEVLGPRDIYRVRAGRYVYRVDRNFLVDKTEPERFFAWALSCGNRVIYVDEQLDIPNCNAEKILAVQGRAAGVGLWVSTQRPHGVPLYALSECNHQFIFRLRLKRDRERVEEATSGAAIPWDALEREFSFAYVDAKGDVSEPARLKL